MVFMTLIQKKSANAKRYDALSYIDVLSRDLKVMDASAISLSRENDIPILVFSISDSGGFNSVLKHEWGIYSCQRSRYPLVLLCFSWI